MIFFPYFVFTRIFQLCAFTDLPSILSNRRLGFIDPHEEHFNEGENRKTGFDCLLKRVPEIMKEIPDQFSPYIGIFDCNNDSFVRGQYNGTLFRFPLRVSASKLSQTLYSEEKVEHLFKSFMYDARLVLLFLRNVESIELYRREKWEGSPRCIFRVQINDDSVQEARYRREVFFDKIKPGQHMPEPVTTTYPLTIKTEKYASTPELSTERYLVTNYCCGGTVSLQFEKLLTDHELSYLPSVGVAMAIPIGVKCTTPNISGHVFCALPLPIQAKSITGLPVHVNGFFALSQNRRHIKLPNAYQEEQGELTDKSLLWNCCLLREAVPAAYATLISEAISKEVPPEAIYK